MITLAALLTAGVTARLGFWQLDRAAQKDALRSAIEERGRLPPLDGAVLAADAAQASLQHHRRVTLVGRWAAEHTVFLDNRQLATPQPGFFVLTPLMLADGRAVLVQRGWAPRHPAERTRVPATPTPVDEVRIDGRIAPPPARTFAIADEARSRIRQNVDLDEFARETGLHLVPLSVLQLDPVTPPDGLLRAWPAAPAGQHRHLGYAFQWFGLSTLVVVLYVWFQFIQPRRGRR